ncbi:MAG: glycosyltransferase family 2 protein [Terriglobales bacterium]
MGLSVAIVAHNEEKNLPRTLESVRWAEEIVVVDSLSTDRTCEIARQYGAKVIVEPWRGYAAQKNYAIENCTQDWVLSLDADEEISHGLADEIRRAIADPNALNGYFMPRKNLYLGKWVRYGGMYPDPKLRLFRRGRAHVIGPDPHDRVVLNDGVDQRTGRFRNAMVHYTYPTLTLYIEHMNRYSSLMAKAAIERGHGRFSLMNIVVRPWATFFYNYVIRGGFLDGKEGLLLHMYHAVYVSWKYAKAWEMAQKDR